MLLVLWTLFSALLRYPARLCLQLALSPLLLLCPSPGPLNRPVKPELALRHPFLRVLVIGCVLLGVFSPLQPGSQERRGFNEPGRQATGPERFFARGWDPQTAPPRLNWEIVATQCSEGLALTPRSSLEHPGNSSVLWAISKVEAEAYVAGSEAPSADEAH